MQIWNNKPEASHSFQAFIMRITAIFSVMVLICFACSQDKEKNRIAVLPERKKSSFFKTIGEIPAPEGTIRVPVTNNAFGSWLRQLELRKDNRVYLHNNILKADQSKHFAVIDISTGKKDLQQCADAIMRLRAEFFYEKEHYDSIRFYSSRNMALNFSAYIKGYRYYLSGEQLLPRYVSDAKCKNRKCFMQYLETVFAFSGTYNLFDQLKQRPVMGMQIGDVLIAPGSPGHAMIVVDMAADRSTGKKYYMLAQGYMPAQDMHIVLNPKEKYSPWFELDNAADISTPYWKFTPAQLRSWN
jgi:hypothetical protein